MGMTTMRSRGMITRILMKYKKFYDYRKKLIDKRKMLWHTHHIS